MENFVLVASTILATSSANRRGLSGKFIRRAVRFVLSRTDGHMVCIVVVVERDEGTHTCCRGDVVDVAEIKCSLL